MQINLVSIMLDSQLLGINSTFIYIYNNTFT